MGLSIFSFDLAALINSLSELMNASEEEITDMLRMSETSLTPTTEVLAANAEMTDSLIRDIMLATTNGKASASIISDNNVQTKENGNPRNLIAEPALPGAANSDDEYRKIIEQLIKSLQFSVIHSYQSADIVNEKVALNTIADFPKKRPLEDDETKSDKLIETKKREELKLRQLKEELKKAMLKNNANYL